MTGAAQVRLGRDGTEKGERELFSTNRFVKCSDGSYYPSVPNDIGKELAACRNFTPIKTIRDEITSDSDKRIKPFDL
jgi:hypothetical protein